MELEKLPEELTDCNCSICRKLGVLWTYYPPKQVKRSGETDIYIWGDRMLEFHRCKVCGCVVAWQDVDPTQERMGVNARLMDPAILSGVRVRYLDGAETWKVLAWMTHPPHASGPATAEPPKK